MRGAPKNTTFQHCSLCTLSCLLIPILGLLHKGTWHDHVWSQGVQTPKNKPHTSTFDWMCLAFRSVRLIAQQYFHLNHQNKSKTTKYRNALNAKNCRKVQVAITRRGSCRRENVSKHWPPEWHVPRFTRARQTLRTHGEESTDSPSVLGPGLRTVTWLCTARERDCEWATQHTGAGITKLWTLLCTMVDLLGYRTLSSSHRAWCDSAASTTASTTVSQQSGTDGSSTVAPWLFDIFFVDHFDLMNTTSK